MTYLECIRSLPLCPEKYESVMAMEKIGEHGLVVFVEAIVGQTCDVIPFYEYEILNTQLILTSY